MSLKQRARTELYRYLDRKLLMWIDDEVFLSRDATIKIIDAGLDVSTFGELKEEHDRVMFTDAIKLLRIFRIPTGETRKTSGRGMAATTHGDMILVEAQKWCDAWWKHYSAGRSDKDELWEDFCKTGLTTPTDWYCDLRWTLGKLRLRCDEAR